MNRLLWTVQVLLALLFLFGRWSETRHVKRRSDGPNSATRSVPSIHRSYGDSGRPRSGSAGDAAYSDGADSPGRRRSLHNHDRRSSGDDPDDGLGTGCTAVCNRGACAGVGGWRRWARGQRLTRRASVLDIELLDVLQRIATQSWARSAKAAPSFTVPRRAAVRSLTLANKHIPGRDGEFRCRSRTGSY